MISRRGLLVAGGAAALTAPFWSKALSTRATAAPPTCELALENKSLTGTVNAYVTGRELGTDRWMVLRADGSVHHPESPAAPETPLQADCAIPLPGPGAGPVVLTLPRMHGARVYFVRDNTLDFFVNPGPSLVEPAFAEPTDPNFERVWSFCEFTFNDQQLFANISYVDLVTGLPIGLRLEGDTTREVPALPESAVETIAADLTAQAQQDGQPWDKLVIRSGDQVLRVISPQNLMAPSFGRPQEMPFATYWNPYVDQVWQQYASTDLVIDLQDGRGIRRGRVSGDVLAFEGGHQFPRPSSQDIFTCNHGPFANNPGDPDEKKGLLARLAAGFNRSIVHSHPEQPNGVSAEKYYQHEITNHYARIVHANAPIGYAFPYDDVTPEGQQEQAGTAFDGNPLRWTVSVG